jgi:hypothetical protein
MSNEQYTESIPTYRRLNDPTALQGVPLTVWLVGGVTLLCLWALSKFGGVSTGVIFALASTVGIWPAGIVWLTGGVAVGPLHTASASLRGIFAVLLAAFFKREPVQHGAPTKTVRGGLVVDRVPAPAATPTAAALPDWRTPDSDEDPS